MTANATLGTSIDPAPETKLKSALRRLADARVFYEFEQAWVHGLRELANSSDPNGNDTRALLLAAAGKRLRAFDETPDDRARRGWLAHMVDEVQLRGDSELGTELGAVAANELREAFARARPEMTKLRDALEAGEGLEEFSIRCPIAADHVRELGRIAEGLGGSSGLTALCSREDTDLARDLARAMKPPHHLLPTVPEPLRVSRDDLRAWANSDGAASELPRLVRSLIAETEPSAEWLDMPAGTGVASPGWDGTVRCKRGNRFVPAGTSVWELTTQQSGTHDKAVSDYNKRVENSTTEERAELSYVAVACAPWTKARMFESERSGEDDFSRISALNVDHLEEWLSCAPATTVWMRGQIGKPTTGIKLLSNWWKGWLAATTIPIDEEMVLAGRQEAAKDLRDRCQRSPGAIMIGGRVHRDEIIAFVAASLGSTEAAHMDPAHVLYVDSHDTSARLFALEEMSTQPRPQTSVPTLTVVVPSAEYAQRLPAGSLHRMIVPVPGSPQAAITLGAVDSVEVAQRLRSSGFESNEAHQLAGIARTSLIALQRRLAKDPALLAPDWSKGHIGVCLRKCLLVGGWNGSLQRDREVVERITGQSYNEASETLRGIDSGDAPLATVDQLWYSVSPADTWVLLRDHLSNDDVKVFKEIAHEVLTSLDPLHELSGDEAIIAKMNGAKAKYSPQLKSGIATTLALAGSLPPGNFADASHMSSMAESVTSRVLRSAMEDTTPRTWTAVTETLQLLAEAAPDVVLQSLRTCLAQQHTFTQVMFTDSKDVFSDFGRTSPHLQILRALEVVAWSPEHLSAAVDVLGRLAAIDPGGRYSNRPAESLASIMCPWLPHTSADSRDRLEAIRMLQTHHPAVAWNLKLSLLKRHSQLQGVLPQYRDWRPAEPVVTTKEHAETITNVAVMLIEEVGEDPDRWADLITYITHLPEEASQEVISTINRLSSTHLDETFKSRIWPVLRDLVARHREFCDAHWALSEPDLETLERALESLRPTDHTESYGHLFSQGISYLDGTSAADGYEEFQSVLHTKQADAVETIFADGLETVLQFAKTVDAPRQVGRALASRHTALDANLLGAMEDAPNAVTWLGLGYFGQRFTELGWNETTQLLADHEVSATVAADVLRAPPPVASAWKRVDACGADVAAKYWERVTYFEIETPKKLGELLEQCRKSREEGRSGLALQMLTWHPGELESDREFAEEAAAVLEQWIQQPSTETEPDEMIAWELVRLFKVLDEHRDHIGAGRIARLEWQYYPLLGHKSEFNAPNLYREMAHDPELFVQLVELAFKPADPTKDEQTPLADASQELILNAWQVLQKWPTSQFAPALNDDGGLDTEALNEWVDKARSLLTDVDRSVIGDQMIGAALASSPADPGDEWPGVAVRDLLEDLENDQIEKGLSLTILNGRGVTTRAPTGGGDQERQLAMNYSQKSQHFSQWPRTAAIFKQFARDYDHQAGVIDREAETFRRGVSP